MVTRGQYWAIKNSLTGKEKYLINYYELQWHLRHHVPTVDQVAKYCEISVTAVNYYLQRAPVVKALESRGIPFRQHTQSELTATQVAAAITMMNFADTRDNTVKLDQLGIKPATYYAWLNDPQFKNLVDNLADQNIKNIKPTAIGELTKKINAGDWNATKFFLETTGALTNSEQPQSEQMLKMIIEVIQKHVKDPDLMQAIAADLLLVSGNRSLEAVKPPVEIMGSIVSENDIELEKAKKKLGIQ